MNKLQLTTRDGEQASFAWRGVLEDSLQKMPTESLVVVASVCNFFDKVIGPRFKAVKTELKVRFENGQGKRATPSSQVIECEGARIMQTMRTSVGVNQAKLRDVLKAHDLAEDACFDQVTVTELNEKRLELLIASGAFTDEEVKSFTVKKNSASISVKEHAYGIDPKAFVEQLRVGG